MSKGNRAAILTTLLALGRVGDATVVASETCAFDLLDARYERDIRPGELLVVDRDGQRSLQIEPEARRYQCIFEHIYFARPDSRVFGENVDRARRRSGKQLAREHPADADIVIAVPDSSNTAAMGYARVSGLRYEIGLIRNHYIGRTFINPEPGMRSFGVRVKFNPVAGVLGGRRVAVVDDSIVRGTTMRKLVRLIRAAGASQVHLRIASPPIRWPCFYGIDIVPGQLDRGGANNLICPAKTTPKNCIGEVTNSFLVDIAKVDLEELRRLYPEAFKKPYDPAAGLVTRAWVQGGR